MIEINWIAVISGFVGYGIISNFKDKKMTLKSLWAEVKRVIMGIGKNKEVLDHKMILKSRTIVDGVKYEVGGVIINADTHAEAIRKYRRAKGESK